METALFVEESVGGEDMEMGMKDEVIAEGVDSSCSGDSNGKGSVLDIVYSLPNFLRRYKRWFR
jgi:hypothetical protein